MKKFKFNHQVKITISGVKKMGKKAESSLTPDHVIKNWEELKDYMQKGYPADEKREQVFEDLYHMVRLMCDNVPDMIWAKDRDKKFIFTNRAIAEKLLNARDTMEALGKTDMYFANRERSLHPENKKWHTFGEICTDSDEFVLKTEKSGRFDEFGNVKGEFLFLDVHKAPFRDEKGEIIGTVGCARDVTREKEIEKNLTESEKLFHSLIDNMLDAVIILDFEGSILFANRAAFELVDIDPRTPLQGFHVKDFALGQSMMDIENHQQLVKEDKFGFLGNYQIKDKYGQVKWVEGLGRKIEFQGKVANLVNLRDITPRKKAEEELKNREKLLEGVARMNHILINSPNLKAAIQDSLEEIGSATRIDRAYIFKNHVEESTGRLLTSHWMEWTNGQVEAQLYNNDLQNIPYEKLSPDLITNFTQKKPFYSLSRDLDSYTHEIVEKQGILSLLLVPVLVQDKLWGFIGFDNCTQERSWKEYELTILKTAADSIGSALDRYDFEKALTESENKSKKLIKAIPDMMLVISKEGFIQDYSPKNPELMSIPEKEIVGSNISQMGLSPADLEQILKMIKTTLITNTLETIEYALDVPAGNRHFEARFIKLNEDNVLSIIRDITGRVRDGEMIKSSLEEKDILLREIHHRVKNNMQIISSLMNLQIKYENSPEAINILKESQGRVKSMAMVHEKLYKSKSFSMINFKDYLTRLVSDILYTYDLISHIDWKLDMDEIKITMDLAIPLGLIIHEIVSNSAKYAFKKDENGRIDISMKMVDDRFFLRVADNGVGIPEDIEWGKTDTLGLHLIDALVKQIDGVIKLDNSQGTSYEIIFPPMSYVNRG